MGAVAARLLQTQRPAAVNNEQPDDPEAQSADVTTPDPTAEAASARTDGRPPEPAAREFNCAELHTSSDSASFHLTPLRMEGWDPCLEEGVL
jgi:hypothetical protein